MKKESPYRMDVVAFTPCFGAAERQLESLGKYKLENFCDFITEKPEFYSNWGGNQHHWTTGFVWKNVIEKIWAFIGVSPSNGDFEEVENIVDGNNVSFHRYVGNNTFAYKSLSGNLSLIGKHDVLRGFGSRYLDGNEYTDYHRLFVGAHTSCQVFNLNPRNNLRIRFDADSMSIPVIPLVAPFVSEILVVDFHRKPSDNNPVEKFNETHTISICSMFNAKHIFRGRT